MHLQATGEEQTLDGVYSQYTFVLLVYHTRTHLSSPCITEVY